MKEDINELKTLLKVMEQAKHATLQREGFAVEERDKARELFQTAMELAKKYKDERDDARLEWDHCLNLANKLLKERDEYKIGHDRYEKLRRLNLQQIKELYLRNLRTAEHFDTLVDKLN
jgi:hypothetical protein